LGESIVPLENDVVVVSGLPRSGTSLMMQMIHQGGVPAITDEIRIADTDNPRGYYEFEQVKKTKQDASWVPTARGKVVKMVSSLLYDLPSTETYRVIFMERDFGEMLDSQEKMLRRLNRPVAPQAEIRNAFSIHLNRLFEWMPKQSHIRLLKVNYNQLMANPAAMAQDVSHFLDDRLNVQEMLAAIDPSLYRNRKASV
jgi:hypothetical protein